METLQTGEAQASPCTCQEPGKGPVFPGSPLPFQASGQAGMAGSARHRLLGQALQDALRAGAGLLLPEVRDHLRRFLGAGVADVRGAPVPTTSREPPDLYYTLFAQWLCEALEVPTDREFLHNALARQPARWLDPVHRACHACLSARACSGPRAQRLRLLCGLPRALLAGGHEPYALFVAALTLEQCGVRPCWFALAWWAPWNWGTTPQAAAVLAVQALAGAALNRGERAQAWLLDQREPAGGFRASPAARGPDLLSTATARFALALTGWTEPDDDARRLAAFVDACRTPDGLWAGHPDLARGDVEYTFYALLALGAMIRR